MTSRFPASCGFIAESSETCRLMKLAQLVFELEIVERGEGIERERERGVCEIVIDGERMSESVREFR